MKFYRIVIDDGEPERRPHYEGGMAEAHAYVKNNIPKHSWGSTTITETDVPTDKAGVLKILNGVADGQDGAVWGITLRGGLKKESE